MNGLATRNALHDIALGDRSTVPAIDEDAHYAFTKGRASDKLKRAQDLVFPRRPFIPDWSCLDTMPDALGTPAEEARRVEFAAWLYAIESKAGLILIAIMLALTALSLYHTFTKPHAPPAPVKGDDTHYHQRATHLAVSQSIYVNDPHERCLVGLHKDDEGQVIVTHHC